MPISQFRHSLAALVALFLSSTHAQVACSADTPCSGRSLCIGGTCCADSKAAGCLACDNDEDCTSCNVSRYLTAKFKCQECPSGKQSPTGSGSAEECIAPGALSPAPSSNTGSGIINDELNGDDNDLLEIPNYFGGASPWAFYVWVVALCIIGMFPCCVCFGLSLGGEDAGVFISGGCFFCGIFIVSLTGFLWSLHGSCLPGTAPGGNVCTICPPGRFDSANGTLGEEVLQARYDPRTCEACPAGRYDVNNTYGASDDSICVPCSTSGCDSELCSRRGGNVAGCLCLAESYLNSPPPLNMPYTLDPLWSFSVVSGGEICTDSVDSTGLVCNMNGLCSGFTCLAGDCCTIQFDETLERAGCTQSVPTFCTEVAKALFLRNPLTRSDIKVDCGDTCTAMMKAQEAVYLLYSINQADMFVEIAALLILLGVTFISDGTIKRFLFFALAPLLLVDAVLQIWALVLTWSSSDMYIALQEAKCADVTNVNGRAHETTLIRAAESLGTTKVLGLIEVLQGIGEIAIECLGVRLLVAGSSEGDGMSGRAKVSLALQLLGTIIAIVDFTVFTRSAREATETMFSSSVESGEWCMEASNGTMTCVGEQFKVNRVGDLGDGFVPSEILPGNLIFEPSPKYLVFFSIGIASFPFVVCLGLFIVAECKERNRY